MTMPAVVLPHHPLESRLPQVPGHMSNGRSSDFSSGEESTDSAHSNTSQREMSLCSDSDGRCRNGSPHTVSPPIDKMFSHKQKNISSTKQTKSPEVHMTRRDVIITLCNHVTTRQPIMFVFTVLKSIHALSCTCVHV